jgi:hypothetical protein
VPIKRFFAMLQFDRRNKLAELPVDLTNGGV